MKVILQVEEKVIPDGRFEIKKEWVVTQMLNVWMNLKEYCMSKTTIIVYYNSIFNSLL